MPEDLVYLKFMLRRLLEGQRKIMININWGPPEYKSAPRALPLQYHCTWVYRSELCLM